MVHIGEKLAVASSKAEDGGSLPTLQLPWAGVLNGDVPLLFPVIVEVVWCANKMILRGGPEQGVMMFTVLWDLASSFCRVSEQRGTSSHPSVVYPNKGEPHLFLLSCIRTNGDLISSFCRVSEQRGTSSLPSVVYLNKGGPHLFLLSCIRTKGFLCWGGASTEDPNHGPSASGKVTWPSCETKLTSISIHKPV